MVRRALVAKMSHRALGINTIVNGRSRPGLAMSPTAAHREYLADKAGRSITAEVGGK